MTNPEPGCDEVVKPENKPELTDLRAIRSRGALQAALLALLDQKPLEDILVRDITSLARTSYATFYRHYATKEALLEELARQQVRQLVDMALPVVDSISILSAYKTLFTHVDQHRAVWKVLLNGGGGGMIKQELLRISRETASVRADMDKSPSVELRIILVVTCTVELLAWWLSQPNQMTVAEVAQILDSTVIEPLMQRNQSAAN